MRYLGLAFVCFCASLLGSAVTIAISGGPEHGSGTARDAAQTITARELVLTDGSGKVRVRLRANGTEDGIHPGQIVMYDDAGVARWRAGIHDAFGSFLAIENTPLPNPDHKQILLAANDVRATLNIGHGTLDEIVVQSGPPNATPTNSITLRGRNTSEASIFSDPFGHATIEVRDPTKTSVFRAPEARPLLP